MKTRHSRVSFTALATFLFLVAAFDPTPSQPSISTAGRRAPDPGALATAEWIAGRAGGPLAAFRPRDLDAAMAPEPSKRHAFELFRETPGAPDPLTERSFLAKLPYGRAMWRAAARNRLDGLLLAAVVETESSFSPKAVSPDGAIGLMQVIPETGALYGKTDLFDPYVNLDVGCQYLAALIDRYHGDLTLAVAAYNAGPAAVTRYGGVPPYPETRDYVKSVLSRYVDHRQSVWKAEAGRFRDESLTTRERTARAGHSLFDRPPQTTPAGGGERSATALAR
jgi:soluble lytic murein transglycosylase-like protein